MIENLPHSLRQRIQRGRRTPFACLGMIPVVPPKSNRIEPWEYDRALYKKRNEIERLFQRLKGFRRIFSRFEKLDVLFLGFLNFALIIEALR
jgi:transposase